MKRTTSLAVACLLAVAGVAAGCGGGDSDNGDNGDSGTTAASISKPEFIQKADQICSESVAAIQTKLQAEFGNLSGPPTGDQLSRVAEIAGEGVKDEVEKIRALGIPAGDEDQVNSFLDAAESGADDIIDNPDQLQGSGPASNADITRANQEAKAYGLEVCGQGG